MADINQHAQKLLEAGLLEPGETLLSYLDQGLVSGRPRGVALTGERLFSFSESGVSREIRFEEAERAECKARSRRTARYEFETERNGTVSLLLSGDPGELGPFCDELNRVLEERFEGFEALEPPEEEPEPEPVEVKPPEPEPAGAPQPEGRGEEAPARVGKERDRREEPAPSPYEYRSVRMISAPSRIAVAAFLLGVAGLFPRYGVPFAIAAAGLAIYNRFRADTRDPDWDPLIETLAFIFAVLGMASFLVYSLALRNPQDFMSIYNPNFRSDNTIAGAVVGIAVLLFSVSFHEAAHGLVSYWNGDSTAAHLGRITLNPIPHIDLFGSIILPLVLYISSGAYFAYAKPVPVNPNRYRNLRAGYITVSFAGPGTNFLLAIVAIWLQFFLISILMLLHHATGSGVLFHPAVTSVVFYVLNMLFLVNIFLGFFNLIPIPPLDGYHILQGILPWKWTDFLRPVEGYGFFILFILLLSGGFSGVFKYVIGFAFFLIRVLLVNPFLG
jgi:Zn-dependent protease